ncbi:MAG: hypothetical protein ACKPKO_31665, partial [Candidatus Fonsibacter sp.]
MFNGSCSNFIRISLKIGEWPWCNTPNQPVIQIPLTRRSAIVTQERMLVLRPLLSIKGAERRLFLGERRDWGI